MNKTGNASQYRELLDSELELVSGGTNEELKAIAIYNLFMDAAGKIINSMNDSLKNTAQKA